METYGLTTERRKEVCIHEAAHAVIHAIGGSYIYSLAVAPVGAQSWQYTGRKGAILTELWGCCCISDHPATMFLKWDAEAGYMSADRNSFRAYVNQLSKAMKRELRRSFRAHACGTLAGPMADAILQGEIDAETYLESDCYHPDDISISEATTWLLPFRNEFDYLTTVTKQALRTLEIWERVLKLADALEQAGTMENDIDDYLPERVPNWPKSPRSIKRYLDVIG